MTIVVSVRVNDGIVLASDSATTIADASTGQVINVYNHADKVFNLVKGLPIGAMTYGNGSFGPALISTLSKDLRRIFTPTLSKLPTEIDPGNYTISDVAVRCRDFFENEYKIQYPGGFNNFFMGYRVGGFSSGAALAEAWEVCVTDQGASGPTDLYLGNRFGVRWAGDTDALDRLILGVSQAIIPALEQSGMSNNDALSIYQDLVANARAELALPAMPIQDAIELARFLAETAARFAHFTFGAATVGGPIEVATVTKHEGFKWVSRKHYFATTLNGDPK